MIYKRPKQFSQTLQESIVSQDAGIEAVASAIAAHIVKIHHNERDPEHPIKKDNLLIIGPTGSGKSESVRTILREYDLDIPMVVANAANLTPSGYKNKNTESILDDLIKDSYRIIRKKPKRYLSCGTEDQQKKQALEAAIKLANRGIIVLDEIDKLRINPKAREDENYFPRRIQEQILKTIEGTTGLGEEGSPGASVDTSDILFILCGAHTGLDDIIKSRLNGQANAVCSRIGFKDKNAVNQKLDDKTINYNEENNLIPTTEDLITYGYLPELIGRISLVTRFKKLTEEDLYKILKASKLSTADNFILLFREIGCKLDFTDNALKIIAQQAAKLNIGARGLRKVLAAILYPIYHDIEGSGQKITITSQTAGGTAGPIITQEDQAIAEGRRCENPAKQEAINKFIKSRS